MFSLVITIISIALVAALALATLYYGGDAFNQGRADAKASQILSHGQQLMAAADLYKANHGVFPPSTAALIAGGYLRSVPMAQGGALNTALAVDQAWVMPLPGVPVFVLPATESGPCQRVNLRSFRMDGILAEVNESIAAQCYGPSTNTADLKTVVSKSGTYLSALATAVSASNPDLDPALPLTPADFGAVESTLPDPAADDGTWSTPPGEEVVDSGGGSGGSVTVPPELFDVDANGPAENVFMAVGQHTGWTSTKDFVLGNSNDDAFTIQGISLSDNGLGFSVSGCTNGQVLESGGACTLSLTFAPSTTPNEYRYVTLTVQTTAGTVSTEVTGYINPVE